MRHPRTFLAIVLVTGILALVMAAPVAAGWNPNANGGNSPVGFGYLYLDDEVTRTNVPPSAIEPGTGLDPLYRVMNGVDGQLGIAGVGPGSGDYHGGKWAVYDVQWNDPADAVLLTSAQAVMDAAAAGDLTVVRNEAADFRCPLQQGNGPNQ